MPGPEPAKNAMPLSSSDDEDGVCAPPPPGPPAASDPSPPGDPEHGPAPRVVLCPRCEGPA
eukprot:11492040-Alexandrium_andersonii.AAC.1